jgi:pyruvate, water dikinase
MTNATTTTMTMTMTSTSVPFLLLPRAQGTVNPDEYRVFKPTLVGGFRPIISRRLGSKESKMVWGARVGRPAQCTVTVPTPFPDREKWSLTDDDVLTLAEWGVAIEKHYGNIPMDIEWAKDGESGNLFVVQARPETVQSQKDHDHAIVQYKLGTEGKGKGNGSRRDEMDMDMPGGRPPETPHSVTLYLSITLFTLTSSSP